jgi:ribosomal protein S30
MVSHGLVSHTSLKKAGKLRNAASRSFNVKGAGRVFFGGRVCNRYPFQINLGKIKKFVA